MHGTIKNRNCLELFTSPEFFDIYPPVQFAQLKSLELIKIVMTSYEWLQFQIAIRSTLEFLKLNISFGNIP